MSIIILFICFALIFLSLSILLSEKMKTNEIILTSVISFSTILVLITEISSILHSLNYQFIAISWSIIIILNILFLYPKRQKVKNIIGSLFNRCTTTLNQLSNFEKRLFFIASLILILILIQSFIYPPNNWDSMTYHLSRTTNWISNGSIEHYPTHIYRQIYQPPFSEFVMTHFNLLNKSDYFSNSIQFFFLLFSLVTIFSITDLLGLNRRIKLIAILLTISIPEVILQASSTQNDIVVSFFMTTTAYFAFKSIKQNHFYNYLFFGLSIGLAFLTKATAYIYLAPILISFLVAMFMKLKRSKNITQFAYSFIILIGFLSINLGHYHRNYKLSGNLKGVHQTELNLYTNEAMSAKYFASNFIKNIGLHIAPAPISDFTNKSIEKIHSFIDVDINDNRINFHQTNYSNAYNIQNHEDYAPNTIHFILILLAIILISVNLLKSRKDTNNLLYLLIIIIQILLFSLILKWQPWHSRLHTPIFIFSIPIICIALSYFRIFKNYIEKLIPLLLLGSLFLVLFNYTRPYISSSFTSEISITDSRQKKYFSNRLDIYKEYEETIKLIDTSKSQNIGLILGGDDWEYPLFTNSYRQRINPIHISPTNITKRISMEQKNIDCIVSTIVNDSIIKYQGKKFYNQSPENEIIWFYK